ncbi:gamma-glutamylcyclotransferase [Clostridium pasteurianum]|uniref:gamma-glutamylcyclotransferase family protein n=1 Tax=Clostridium pasteurianum TaxID=1501 RepID=UPI002260B434|nr:gamma-glutamylcyclotransferase family protein [Clostridium pasteurianum]UZW12584.1 gamma-glutamylcyclotransferase [Clostridium pasteurianum]
MSKLYIAYGSNMNLEQMAYRCPTAKVKGAGSIIGWNLVFRGNKGNAYATIEPDGNKEVPVVIWEIESSDEKALDRYEGYPRLYRKENIKAVLEGEEVEAMVYIMNGKSIEKPSRRYYEIIRQGYIDNGIDVGVLDGFLEE